MPLVTWMAVAGVGLAGWAGTAEPTSLGGRWTLEPGHVKPRYVFRDGERAVDLFSYHQSDSNKDGTDEVWLRHEPGLLVIDSQGWPNHPTATFPNGGNAATALIDVPADASLGTLLDCHVEFETGRRPRVIKKHDVLRIIE